MSAWTTCSIQMIETPRARIRLSLDEHVALMRDKATSYFVEKQHLGIGRQARANSSRLRSSNVRFPAFS